MWVVLTLCLLSASTSGTASVEQAEAAFKAGLYRDALPLLEQALQDAELPRADRVRAYGLLALVHAAFDHREEAIAAYARAVEADPRFHPGSEVSPKVRGLFDQGRARARPPAVESPAPLPAVAVAAPAPEQAPRWYRSKWLLIGGGLVLASAATAAALVIAQPGMPTGNVPNGTLP